MAHMDIFNQDAFRVMDLSEAIEIIPNQWGLIGEMGLFTPKSIIGDTFSVEMRNGVLQLIQSSERGTALPAQGRKKRKIKSLRTERFGLQSNITANDVDKIRAFGKVSELQAVSNEVFSRQEDLRGSTDITREYHRAGAIQGIVYDADGSVLTDLFDEFGGSRLSVDFLLGTATTDLMAKCRKVTRHVRTRLKGDVMSGVMGLMNPYFTDKLMGHDDFAERYKYYVNLNGGDPLRDDESDGFKFGGILWKEYLAEAEVPQEDGSSVTRSFVPDGEVNFFPVGTRSTFRTFNGSADYMTMVNQPGQNFYSAVFRDRRDRFVDVEGMMQNMQICMRPEVLVRGHTSN